MSLLERVATLIKANLNDLIDRAEDPEKLLKQLLLDMQNQYMQLKTQTAIAIANQHLLDAKRAENAAAQASWLGKAELALNHADEGLARLAVERALTHENAATSYANQLDEQSRQVTTLRESLVRLESKMTETRTQADLLLARHRRARAARQAADAAFSNAEFRGQPGTTGNHDSTLERLRAQVLESEALGHGATAVHEPTAQSKLEALEKSDRIEALLAELKNKRTAQG